MRKRRILIVDDEKGFTEMLRLNLEDTLEYEVRTENDSPKALAAARAFKPDIIFLDIIMPGMDGGAVLGKLREDVETRDIPVVFLTAIVGENEADSLKAGISGYPVLSKPVSFSKLTECIKKTLR
jgi:CheY-like chemotaxis protein